MWIATDSVQALVDRLMGLMVIQMDIPVELIFILFIEVLQEDLLFG